MDSSGLSRDEAVPMWVEHQLFKRLIDPQDISNAVLFLASEESRNVTGFEMTVDGGTNAKAA